MSYRAPVIGIVDNLNGLSWKYDPSWVEHFVKKYGSFEAFATEARRQFELALFNAERTLVILEQNKPTANASEGDV